MAKVNLIAVQPYKGRAVGESFTTSLKNSRELIASGVAKAVRKAPAKKAAAKKVAAKKVPAKKAARTYNTRALKAK